MSNDKSVAKIEFPAEVIKVQTMESGALRVVMDMPEYCIPQMAMLAECKRNGIYLHAVFTDATLTDLDEKAKIGDEAKEGAEGTGTRVGRRRTTNRRDQ